MTDFDEKIAAVSALMENGILSKQEHEEIVELLSKKRMADVTPKSPFESQYENFMKNNIAVTFKNPFSVKFPPLQRSMMKQGELSVCLEEGVEIRQLRYIETYAESTNAYGDVRKENIAIILDEKSNFTMVLQELKHSLMQTGMRQWVPMPGVLL